MTKGNIQYFLFMWCMLCTLAGSSQALYLEEVELPTSAYTSNFLEITEQVNKHYIHFENKGIDREAITMQFQEEVASAEDLKTYMDVLLRYFASLENGHTGMRLGRYYVDASATLVEERLFMASVYDSTLLASGIRPKDEIIAIDGIPAYRWLEKESAKTCASTDEARVAWTSWRVFYDFFAGGRTYTFQTKSGVKEVTLNFGRIRRTSTSDGKTVIGNILRDSIGYINIRSMTGDVVQEFKTEYERLSALPYLVIDIRKNGGGNSGFSENMLRYLIKAPVRASVSRMKKKPTKNAYQGKLYLLIGWNTFSSAESFALDLKETEQVTIIGSPTGGDTGNGPKWYKTSYGFKFRFPSRYPPQVSFAGFPMEGEGIVPDHLVHQSVEDYLENRDTVLEYTLEHIGESL